MCTMEKCTPTCVKCKLGLGCPQEDGLNACLRCDEDLCGPAFKKCAGANRRRSGIVSDIVRNDTSICKFIDK